MSVVLRFTIAGLVIIAAACRPGPLRVDAIQLGRSLNPDQTVAGHTTVFKRFDTVYLSLLSSDPGAGTIQARWTYAGRVVDEPEKEVSYRGAGGATEFHLQSADGFPPGDYNVEVFVDGVSVGSRAFKVEP